MEFNLWTQYGALNSKPVFEAFAEGCRQLGHSCTYNGSNGIDVIWSVLWNGRMLHNQKIWSENKRLNKPTIVLEVGGIKRGTTWKVGLNGINRDGDYLPDSNDSTRASLQGLKLKPWRTTGDFILVCGQHNKSLQWQDMPSISNWFLNIYDEIRKHTDRPILLRPHPRCRLDQIERGLRNVHRQEPMQLVNTYDDFDMTFNDIWATVSHSSNPGAQSIIAGVPSFVSPSSLAYDVANDIDFFHDIEDPLMPDRTQWLNDYAWTEFTVEEISQGIPLKRLTSMLE
jgi:hypothetical protein